MANTSWTYVCLSDVKIIINISYFDRKIGHIWSSSHIENTNLEEWINSLPKKPNISISRRRNLTKTMYQYCDKDGSTHWRDRKLSNDELEEYGLIFLCYRDEFGSEGADEAVVIDFDKPSELLLFKMMWLS